LIQFTYPNDPEDNKPKPRKPLTEKVDELEAAFMYNSMMKDMVMDDMNNGKAEMMYQLMMKGVI